MATKWSEIRRKHSPEVEEGIRREVAKAGEVMTLQRLGEARQLAQVNLSKLLNVNQEAVSMIEKHADIYISTLRRYIEAMGGELRITAEFPVGTVQIDQFENLAET